MKVLMVCLGNICRSPLAQGILEHMCKEKGLQWEVDSAGTSAYHIGEKPDTRSIDIAQLNGIDISRQQARQVVKEDLNRYDLILAMDQSNFRNLLKLSNSSNEQKIKLMLSYGKRENLEVPDPYYVNGFDIVFDMINEACEALVNEYQLAS